MSKTCHAYTRFDRIAETYHYMLFILVYDKLQVEVLYFNLKLKFRLEVQLQKLFRHFDMYVRVLYYPYVSSEHV